MLPKRYIKMVTRIKHRSKDPNNKGRGPGLYYHRGNGVYSKYLVKRDRNKKSTGWEVNIVGVPKGSKLLHVSDGNLKNKIF